MEVDFSTVVSIVSIVISLMSAMAAFLSWRTARAANRQVELLSLFTSFDLASQALLQEPRLLYTVHGLEEHSNPLEEAKSIAYLGLLLDGFERFYRQKLTPNQEFGKDQDFSKMVEEMKANPTYLNSLLAIPANQERWEVLKRLFYNEGDRPFTKAIDDLIQYENRKLGQAT